MHKVDKYPSHFGGFMVLGTIWLMANTVLWYVNASIRDITYYNLLAAEFIFGICFGIYFLFAETKVYG